MSIAELVRALCGIFGEDERVLSRYARELIDWGHIPKSVGKAIYQATPGDAAALLIAYGASHRPTQANDAFEGHAYGNSNPGDTFIVHLGKLLAKPAKAASVEKICFDTIRAISWVYLRNGRKQPFTLLDDEDVEATKVRREMVGTIYGDELEKVAELFSDAS